MIGPSWWCDARIVKLGCSAMRKWKSADIRNIAASATARVTVYFRSQMMCLCNTFSRRRRRRWLGSSALRRAKTTTTMMMSQMPSSWCDIVWEAWGHKMLGSCDRLQLRIEMFVYYAFFSETPVLQFHLLSYSFSKHETQARKPGLEATQRKPIKSNV